MMQKEIVFLRDDIPLVALIGDKATVCSFQMITQNIAVGH